jgi:hypothetical protein
MKYKPRGKPFKKGRARTGGRAKGTPNKFTNLKQAFINAFQKIGHEDALVEFYRTRKNRRAFFQMMSGMLPKDVQLSGPDGQPLPANAPQVNVFGTVEALTPEEQTQVDGIIRAAIERKNKK